MSAAVTLAAVITACGSGSSSSSGGSEIKLAGVFSNTSDPFFKTQVCAAEAEATKLGASLKSFESTTTDTNQIANNFQSASLTNPDGMFVTPFNNNQFIAQYKSLMAKGVPVTTNNGTQPASEYKYIASATDTARFAETVLEEVPAGSGTAAFLGGAPGIPPLENRVKPFVQEVEKLRPELDFLPTEYSGFDVNKVTQDLNALLLANPDLKLIIVADGPDAAGAASALKTAGKAGKITVVAFDAIPPEVEALEAGTINFLIAQNPTEIADKAIKALVTYLEENPEGGQVPNAGEELVPNELLTKENVSDPANSSYIYKEAC